MKAGEDRPLKAADRGFAPTHSIRASGIRAKRDKRSSGAAFERPARAPMRSIMIMRYDMTQTALATWAAKDIPCAALGWRRGEAVELLNGGCRHSRQRGEITSAGQAQAQRSEILRGIELITFLADLNWLDKTPRRPLFIIGGARISPKSFRRSN